MKQGAAIMGIVNVTPDSFSDGGMAFSPDTAVEHALRLVQEGADILDIGGESTRPGATPVTADEELRRVRDVIAALGLRTNLPLSIDTYRSQTARAALEAGASIINDVSGLRRDTEMVHVAAAFGSHLIINHWEEPREDAQTIMTRVRVFFERAVEKSLQAGVNEANIILDPGIGFGKGREENLVILNRLEELCELGFPVLVGASRKRMIGEITGVEDPKQRLAGTLATHLWALERGAAMIRVHDVAAHKQALLMHQALSAGQWDNVSPL